MERVGVQVHWIGSHSAYSGSDRFACYSGRVSFVGIGQNVPVEVSAVRQERKEVVTRDNSSSQYLRRLFSYGEFYPLYGKNAPGTQI